MSTESMDQVSDLNIDIDAAADTLASELGLGIESPESDSATPTPDSGKAVEDKPASPAPDKQDEPGKSDQPADKPAPEASPASRPAPKSWPQEAHALWAKLDDPTRDMVERREQDFLNGIEQYKGDATYGKSLKEVITPYVPLIEAAGIDAPTAVGKLLNAHYQLSQTDEAARTQFMANLLKAYRIDHTKLASYLGDEEPYKDPAVAALKEQVDNLTQAQQAERAKQAQELRARVDAEVEAFAKDPAHPYFNEVAADIELLLRGSKMSLQDAYDRAVRMNPVTWEKEQSRIRKETEEAVLKKAREDAERARKAKGLDVRGAESERSPTEPLGSMDDTLREAYRAVTSRTS